MASSTRSNTVILSNDQRFPKVGYGTYYEDSESEPTQKLVEKAIDAGYRLIDTAYMYENEKDVGAAISAKIKAGVIKREEIFVTTKLWATFNHPDHVAEAFQRSLDNLGLEYIDLYLLQSPIALEFHGYEYTNLRPKDAHGNLLEVKVDFVHTWHAMENLLQGQKVRGIGLANFREDQIRRLWPEAKVKPVVNQIELYPGHVTKHLINYCLSKSITVMAFGPLGRIHRSTYGDKCALVDKGVQEIGKKYGKSNAQVILRYMMQLKTIPLPYLAVNEQIAQYIDVFDFELTKADMEYMETLNTKKTAPYHVLTTSRIVPYYPTPEEIRILTK